MSRAPLRYGAAPFASRSCGELLPQRVVGPAIEGDRVADADHPSPEHGSVDATCPSIAHGGAQAWERLVHALARPRLTADVDHALADAQQTVAAVGQGQAADHQ